MAESTSKAPIKPEKSAARMAQVWRPFENLRGEGDRLFDEFGGGFWRSPFRSTLFDAAPFGRGERAFTATPAVDISETEKGYEITAKLPGIDEKNVKVKLANGIRARRRRRR